MAMHVAMAHAGLALTIALLFGLIKLLQSYWRPIQWAILCSMPLRELQTPIVSFWSHPLRLGLFETLIAIPIAILRATTASLLDSHAAILRLLSCRSSPLPPLAGRVGFFKLMQWLVTFGLFVLVYERIGLLSIPVVTVPCFIAYITGFGVIVKPGLASTLSRISSARKNRTKFRNNNRSLSFFSKFGQYITSTLFYRLNTMVGIGLILFMIVGSVLGFAFFSYKIAIEGKEAVISLKIHLEVNNYGEMIGINKWMDENQIPELIDGYMTKFYETLSQNIDSWADYYNVTEVVDGFKQYFVQGSTVSSIPDEKVGFRTMPLNETLHSLQSKVRNREWKVIYRDFNGVFKKFMSLIANEDLLEKIKAFLLQSLDVSKRVLLSCSMVLASGANLLFFVAILIVSGAAGLVNFIFQLMVFLWLLYYLITSESGGVMDHVLGMLPVSRSTRNRCAQVLDHAVSSVLLATAKLTLFQGCFTYLLFRFYRIHFLYMSTFLALLSAVLPITPAWISSIPAALQLAMESRYIEAILLTAVHLILLDYGTMAIQDEIPGHNAYLTGLSIFGGIAFFPSILEGAIMGPLVMTVIIAFKNLYIEFVLAFAAENSQ
ncbi:hypothetical protein COLO4_29131 [Corchorus olitorius]|uniref:Transmembrane protein TqsA-like protein n=1 Tax=Corchorus olitorius TaxID=93759 RepID=A0A1R3HG87_9ROSI|nr:hypothetical protein COLO4_29131 [Corchorus olitorius]